MNQIMYSAIVALTAIMLIFVKYDEPADWVSDGMSAPLTLLLIVLLVWEWYFSKVLWGRRENCDQGAGSSFWFESALSQSGTPRAKEREAQQSIRAAKTLLVEEVPVNQEWACAILRRDAREVDTVDNGEEAVEASKAYLSR